MARENNKWILVDKAVGAVINRPKRQSPLPRGRLIIAPTIGSILLKKRALSPSKERDRALHTQ